MTTVTAALVVALLCLLVLTAAGLFEVAAKYHSANKRAKAFIAANRALNSENTRLHLELTEAQLLAGKNPRALRLVRETSDYDWPALARAIDMEGGE